MNTRKHKVKPNLNFTFKIKAMFHFRVQNFNDIQAIYYEVCPSLNRCFNQILLMLLIIIKSRSGLEIFDRYPSIEAGIGCCCICKWRLFCQSRSLSKERQSSTQDYLPCYPVQSSCSRRVEHWSRCHHRPQL